MRQTSALYKTLLADPGHIKQSRLIIGGVVYDESQIVTLSTNEALFAEDTLSVGGAIAREIDFSAFLDDSVPRRAQIIHEVRLITSTQASEWLQKGVYYISTRSHDPLTGVTTVHGFDAMMAAEQEWKPAQTDIFPMSMKEAVEKTAAILHLALDPRNVYKTGDDYKVSYPVADGNASEEEQVKGLSIRQVWRWIAGAMGGNFIINDLGELRLVPVIGATATAYLADENGDAVTFGGDAILLRVASADSPELSALGNAAASVQQFPAFEAISRVILKIGGDQGYVSGSDTGRTIEIDCAYGSQTMANDLLAQLQGYVYQPMQADDALIDPAAELGDPVEVCGVYAVLAQKDTMWDMLSAADIAAPGGTGPEDEYSFSSAAASRTQYELAQARSLISKTNDRISMEIYGEDGKGGLNGKMATFTMSLSSISGQIEGYKDTVTGYEKQLAAYRLELDGYSGKVSKYTETVDGYTEQIISYRGTVEGYEQTVAQYSQDVTGYKKEYSTISQTLNGIKLEATNSNGTVSIQLKSGNTALGTPGTIDLTGLVSFTDLKSNTKTVINGNYITTGTIKANRLKLYGELKVYKGEDSSEVGGYLGYCEGWNPYTKEEMEDDEDLTNPNIGIGVMNSDVTGQCICTDAFARLSFGNYSAVLVEEGYLQLNGYGAIYFGLPEGTLTAEGHPNEFKDYALLDDETFRCCSDGLLMLGTASRSWDVLYAGSCSCCDSDLNKKNSIEALPDKYLAMFDNLEPVRFKLNKGKSGRFHVGYIAQEVKTAMDAADIDSTEFGGWVMDTDEDGNEIYMLRYEEFGAIYAAKIKQLEARLAKLEETA